MKFFSITLMLFAVIIVSAQENLLKNDTDPWVAGASSVTGFVDKGSSPTEDVRVTGINPYGESSVLWEAVPSGDSQFDGGWESDYIYNINPLSTYRLTVWIKKTGSIEGRTLFGVIAIQSSGGTSTLVNLDNTESSSSRYIWATPEGDLPELDKWYLLVAYVHGKDYTGTTNQGGIWDPATGQRIELSGYEFNDLKLKANAGRLKHRAFLYRGATDGSRQYFYNPTVYEMNGSQPEIDELLYGPNGNTNNGGSNTGGGSVSNLWTPGTNNTISYNDGNVGIGVENPQQKLQVAGNIFVNSGNDTDHIYWNRHILELGTVPGSYNHNTLSLKPGGASNGYLKSTIELYNANSETEHEKKVSITSSGDSFFNGGDVAIGTTDSQGWKLAVNGNIRAKEIKVETANWPDYVFHSDYNLPSLEELQRFIAAYGHLPNVLSAKEVEENGVFLGEMNKTLLKKIEELTLYTLQQNQQIKQLEEIKERNKALEDRVNKLEKLILKRYKK